MQGIVTSRIREAYPPSGVSAYNFSRKPTPLPRKKGAPLLARSKASPAKRQPQLAGYCGDLHARGNAHVLRIDHGDGGDVDDVLDLDSTLQQMHRLRHAQQDRADRLRLRQLLASSLQAMLQDCRSGKISTLAPPFNGENGKAASSFLALTAMSPCTSPSMIRVGSA